MLMCRAAASKSSWTETLLPSNSTAQSTVQYSTAERTEREREESASAAAEERNARDKRMDGEQSRAEKRAEDGTERNGSAGPRGATNNIRARIQ